MSDWLRQFKYLILVLSCTAMLLPVLAQEKNLEMHKHGVTLEVGANSGFLAVNVSYHHFWGTANFSSDNMVSFVTRIGCGTAKLRFDSPRFWCLPLEHCLLVGRGSSKLELGLGYTAILGSQNVLVNINSVEEVIKYRDRICVRVGYSYIPKVSVFPLVRIAWTPMYNPDYNPIPYTTIKRHTLLWGGVSLGIVF